MDNNEFFREATLRICGSLEIEKALFSVLNFLMQFMPVSIMLIEYYEDNLSATKTIAKATAQGGKSLDLLTPLSPKAMEWASRYQTGHSKQVYLYQNPKTRPLASEMMRFHKISLCSVILLTLETGGQVIGSLIIGSESEEKFTQIQADLISLLSEPFAIAVSNTIKHREVLKFKDLLIDHNKYLSNELRCLSGEEIIGSNYGLKGVMHKVQQVANMNSPVLLLGETGVGKDVIANAIHYSSSRDKGPFISVNCGAIPESLIDSELFGHEKGAFTGAISQKRGRFERAAEGTIFLDEIGDLPLEAQVRLLRVIQNKEIERVGGDKTIKLDIRIIAATNRDLEEMVSKREFRQDLWFRLSVFPIMIPSLRERRADIPALLKHFIELKSRELKLPQIPSLLPGAIEPLMGYNWPGNVRELQNIVERALILNPKGPLTFEHLEQHKMATPNVSKGSITLETINLDEMIVQHIQRVLVKTEGKIHGKGGAADLLGINANTLRNRMFKLGIKYRKKEIG